MNQRIDIILENGTKVQRLIRSGKSEMYLHKLRKMALQNRTKAEIWAENIIKERFHKDEFQVEHVFKFRRFDFYFLKPRIAIEIDGSVHDQIKVKQYDTAVDKMLINKYKITVYRVKNFDQIALFKYLDEIRALIGPYKDKQALTKAQKNKKRKIRRRQRQEDEICLKRYGKTARDLSESNRVPKPPPFVPRTILRKNI